MYKFFGLFLLLSVALLVRGADYEECTDDGSCEFGQCDVKHSAATKVVCKTSKDGVCSCEYDNDFQADSFIRPAPENTKCKKQTSGDCSGKCTRDGKSKSYEGYLCTAKNGKKLCYCGRTRAAKEASKCWPKDQPSFACQLSNCDSKSAKVVSCEDKPEAQSACECRAKAGDPSLKPLASKCWKSNPDGSCTQICGGGTEAWICPAKDASVRLCYCSKK